MLRFLFIQKDNENVGVEYISGALKNAGHKVELLFFPYSFGEKIENNLILNKINQYKPDIVCCSPFSYQYLWSLKKVKFVKKKFRKIFILFGGVHINSVPNTVIKEKYVDAIILGEADTTVVEFAKNFESGDVTKTPSFWYKVGKNVIKNPLAPLETELDQFGKPDKGLFYLSPMAPGMKYLAYTAVGSRGCPFACTYCANNVYRKLYEGQKRFRQRSPEDIVEELVENKKKYSFKRVEFADDVLAIDIPRLKKLMKLYKKKVGLPFSCFYHPKLVKEETVKILSKGGCNWFKLGIQSANEQYRRKYLNRFETNKDVLYISQLCNKYNLRFSFDHIFNLPGETKEHLIEALKFYNQCRPTIINFWGLMYLPGTEIIKSGLEHKCITKKDIKKINRGEFSTSDIVPWYESNESDVNISAFILIFILISLLPKKVVDFLIKIKLYNFPYKIPNILLIPLKVLSKIRARQFYLYKAAAIQFAIGNIERIKERAKFSLTKNLKITIQS